MEKRNIFVLVFMCIIIGILILTLSLRGSADPWKPSSSGLCSVSMDLLPPFEPLFLLKNFSTNYLDAFVLPNSDGFLSFVTGDQMYISCPGANNAIVLNGTATKTRFEIAQCEKGTSFKIIGKSVSLAKISCAETPQRQAHYVDRNCGESKTYKVIEIGFNVSEKFIKHLEVCYNEELKQSLYSHQILSAQISGGRYKLDSSKFKFTPGEFYNKINVDEYYTKTEQMKTINGILNITDTRYIDDKSNDTYLSKGHYSAKADFFYGSQQYLTYYYVNAAPQWATFNSGNWKTIEEKCREFASSRKLNLDIITGSHGVSKLLNNAETMTELYLWKPSKDEKGIPVPRLYYKVVYNQKDESGVAFVGVNNPYMIERKEDIICNDICDQIEWIGKDWNRKDLSLGYLYCCNVDDLSKTIHNIPKLNITSLLT